MNEKTALASGEMVLRKESASKNRYILIVDDEPRIVRSLIRELSGWAEDEGYTMEGAVIGIQALEFIRNHVGEVELVISDIRMPGMSGGRMAREIIEQHPDVRVIVLTAYEDTEEINKDEVDSFITKPWDTESLIREIERVLA